MPQSNRFIFAKRISTTAICLLSVVCVSLAANSRVSGGDRETDAKIGKPVVTATIPSINSTYQDLKLVFDLAHDERNYTTFKETLDEFLVGVDTESPCAINTFVTAEGLATVVSAPIKDEAAFNKFLKNLWDLDVKTAPPPSPQLQKHVPRSVQDKLRSLKPQPNERILFGLLDGALLFEPGHVHLGSSLEAVRAAKGQKMESAHKGASLAIQIRGDVEPSRRRVAFDKSKQDILSRQKRENFESDADFDLAKAVVDYQLAKLELLVADTSQVDAIYTLSRDKKKSRFDAEVTPAAGTALSKDFTRLGQQPDAFAGVSQQNAVVSIAANMPVDEALGALLKVVAEKAHSAAIARIDASQRLDADQVQTDKDLSGLVFEIATDVAGMDTFNSFLRTWTDTEGKLTTVGATRVSDVEKIRERLQKFRHREQVQHPITGVQTVKLTTAHGKENAPELFDADGSVYVATSDKAIWFAMGPQALERLDQAVQAASQGKESAGNRGKSSGQTAVEIHADMLPLTHVWNAIGSRRSQNVTAKPIAQSKPKAESKGGTSKTGTKSDPKTESTGEAKTGKKKTVSSSSVADLQLHKIADKSFKEKDGRFELSLVKDGDKAKLAVSCDEGILRFVGKVLSEFTKQNLADN